MEKTKDKPDVGFQEALRRIAKTPKHVVEKVVNSEKQSYNEKEGTSSSSPPPIKR